MAIIESLVDESKRTIPKRNPSDVFLSSMATGLGAGRLPIAPGTWGSIEAVLLVALIHQLGGAAAWGIHMVVTVGLFLVALPAARHIVRETGEEDPPRVVIDEIVGQCFCLLWVPITWQWLLAGLLLFRLFDIWKPFPIRRLEKVPGGLGIILDDMAAAVYASVLLWGAHQIWL